MKLPTLALLTISLAFGALPALAADAVQPNADAILRAMSDTLAHSSHFRFHAHRHIDAALVAESGLPADAQVTITAERPNKVAARAESKDEIHEIYFNGHALTQVDVAKNLYAVVPLHTSIDGLVIELKQKYGFTPPLAEFTISNVYWDIRQKTQNVSYRGEAVIGSFLGLGGVRCHQLALSGKAADADLWIGVADHLPRRLIAVAKARPGHPHISATFSDWDLAPKVSKQDFTYTPPKGATKITMTTVEEMRATHKRH